VKVPLDECIPRELKFALLNHDCETAPEAGFAGQINGSLLSLAEDAGFELSLRLDKTVLQLQYSF
jgi:hypothetical protein